MPAKGRTSRSYEAGYRKERAALLADHPTCPAVYRGSQNSRSDLPPRRGVIRYRLPMARPRTGTPVHVRLDPAVLAAIDRRAADNCRTRADEIRFMLEEMELIYARRSIRAGIAKVVAP